ncbi:MAG: hypothetical protein LPK00_10560 [Bacillaceae bacterium]|nr:hypothetical protein [Bacillaceae bacterium]
MKNIKMGYIIFGTIILFVVLSILMNPTKQEYMVYNEDMLQEYLEFSKETTGEYKDIESMIHSKNFYLFSTYAPKMPMEVMGHHGPRHIGIMGGFYQLTEGQYNEKVRKKLIQSSKR